VSIVIVDETVAGVAEVVRNEKGRALAFVIAATAAVTAGADSLLFGMGAIHVGAVVAGIIVAGLACLAPYAPKLRRPVRVPVTPGSELATVEAAVLNRFAMVDETLANLKAGYDERIGTMEARFDEDRQRLDAFAALLSDVSAEFSEAAERFRARS
jgi:hypothetical protein